MYRPAVCRKKFSCVSGLASICPVSDWNSLCFGPSWISARAVSLEDRPQRAIWVESRPLKSRGRSPPQERLDSRKREPDPRRDLEGEIESKGCLIHDFGIVPRLRRPVLKHDAGRVLHNERCSDVEQIQRPVGARRALWE